MKQFFNIAKKRWPTKSTMKLCTTSTFKNWNKKMFCLFHKLIIIILIKWLNLNFKFLILKFLFQKHFFIFDANKVRHLPPQFGHWAPHVHKLESLDRAVHLFVDGFPSFRWRPQRRRHRVPDQFGTLFVEYKKMFLKQKF